MKKKKKKLTGRKEWEVKTKKGKRKNYRQTRRMGRRGERNGCHGKQREKNWEARPFYI